ncbi:hypothetical protein [Vibrio parahaemolyticus]|uniref:hypothetical protein n=1 Tax=Vibrio parahaemolyticus TaxID=670 RepID=UPI000870C978|nr:hypothetical protein [Vibrio parahaemolyticus]AOV89756.1 hypothetical protein FORC23_1213 [Vibrio parahaemolyticus]ELB2229744.1 hypothetical protein [Vibrio parahaemolyticus]MBE3794256.1 hypothetical protein [Vibrio parahaemolyticus]MBE3933236.1 hypothetical protein [Vibrio parahaemolyticus]MBE4044141.1 hypothetical protein [Vibrio parahaemolyticus]
MDWFEVIPSSMSAVASVAAAVAAIASWRVSRRATSIAESTALSTHHSAATIVYVQEVKQLNALVSELDKLAFEITTTWSKQLQRFDNPDLGGIDPRPLRHVLHDGYELLADYASDSKKQIGAASRGILSPIRNGMGSITKDEYNKLLKKVDGTSCCFEATLGSPSKSKSITSASAFRWVYYQLLKRVESQDWRSVWKEAWLEEGYLNQYKSVFVKIKPELIGSRDRLRNEKEKLIHTAFPIENNLNLSEQYNQLLGALDCLIEECDSELIEDYKDWDYSEEQCLLVLCSMGLVCFADKQVGVIQCASRF